MHISADDYNVYYDGRPIPAVGIDHVATQEDGVFLFNVYYLEDNRLKVRLYSSDELKFSKKAVRK